MTVDSGEATSAENDNQPNFDAMSIDSEEATPSHADRMEQMITTETGDRATATTL